MTRLLLLIDDPNVRDTVLEPIRMDQAHGVDCTDGVRGLELLKRGSYDLAIVLWKSQAVDGEVICRQSRAAGSETRLCVLSPPRDTDAVIHALDAGADDCIQLPVEPRELAARIRAVLRRPGSLKRVHYRWRGITIDTASRRVTRLGREIHLQPREYQLLEFFLLHPRKYYSPDALLRCVWGCCSRISEEAVRTCIKTLRKKLDDPDSPSIISSTPGFGYRIEIPADG